ncbi:L-2-amino-thiazoline-4-carboxylic acid hydrolase [Roseococcus sp. YIM B11640]|uniref:L-2-amino-thiazoline-4-carboxylic acid hydrolase n=1 Tax=Roseococcus sp. YIM B11640 TaxID=3133973 RepID=UPI003C7A26BF
MTVSILEQRRIEAAFAKGLYEEMSAEIGEEKATEILTRAVVKLARQAGATIAKEAPEPSIAHFAASMERWKLDDALRIDVLREDETHFDFNVTRCRYAESYREMGLGKLGAVLSCNRDGAFCEGYDPRMKLERTQTIMSGATHCNFRYTREA